MEKENIMEEKYTPKFEDMMLRLSEIVRTLEKGDAALDSSLALYEEGAGLIKEAQKQLEEAEQRVVRLQKTADGTPEESDFQ